MIIFLYLCNKYVQMNRMKIKQQYQVRSIAGENVVILQGRYGADLTRIITLNDSALLLWNEVAGRDFSVADIVAILQEHYDVDAATAQRDSELWVAKMKECGLIE